MGLFASRQNATVEETDVSLNHLYKYPPRTGNYFGTHFIMGGERFDTPQPEAYLFGENADLNFLGSKPTPFPYPPPQATEPTKTLKSLVNIRKESVRFVKVSEGGANGNKPVSAATTIANGDPSGKGYPATTINNGNISNGYNIEFVFDADHACLITIYYFCIEDIGAGGLNYISRDSSMTSETFHFQRGVNQVFSAPHHVIYPALYAEEDLSYNPEKDTFPVVIHCVVGEGGSATTTTTTTTTAVGADAGEANASRQSHATICVIDHHSDGTYALRALKQKIFVDGLYYLLQEIYGIENKLTSKSITDEETEDNGSECVICMCDTRDTLILPCRHLCLCNSCADSLRYQANNCPICRAPFRALLQIRAVQKDSGNGLPCGGAPAGQNSTDGGDNIPAGYKTISLIEALNGPTVSSKTVTSSGNDTNATADNGSENNRSTENGYGFRTKMTKSSTDHSSNGELANGSIVSEKSPADIRMHLLASDGDGGGAPGDGPETGGGTGGGISNPTVCTKKELLSKHSPLLQRAPVSKDKNPREKGSLHRIGANATGAGGPTGQGKSKSSPSTDKPIAFHLLHEKASGTAAAVGGVDGSVGLVGGLQKPTESKQTTDLAENDDDSDAEKLSPLLRKTSDSYEPHKTSQKGDSTMKKLLTGGGAGTGTGAAIEMKTSPSTVITELLKGAIIGNDESIGGNGVVGTGGRGGVGGGGGGSIITIVADDSEDYYTPEEPPATSPLKSIDDDDDELPKLVGETDVGRKLLSGVGPMPLLTASSPPALAPPPAPPSALSVLKEEFSQGSLPDSPISGNSQTSTRSSSDSYSSSSSTRQLLSAGAVANDTPTHVLSSGDSTTNGHSGASKSNECSIESD